MKKITKTEELRRRMIAGVDDQINECKKRLEQLTSDRDHFIGRLTALAAVKQVLQAGGNNGKA